MHCTGYQLDGQDIVARRCYGNAVDREYSLFACPLLPIGTRTTEGIKYVIVIKVRRWEDWGYAIALAI
jgi:hypothetical protein